ncbi:MAG: hypothetical protein GX946_10390 [Oligosphaeraceae bacterium]|nr:hypothetical protein [Oligosphaeraceae bacterium]
MIPKKLRKFNIVLSAFLVLGLFAVSAAEDTAVKPAKKSADELLAFIPAEVALLNDKVVVSRDDVVKLLKPQLEQALLNGAMPEIPQAQIEAVVYNLSKQLMTYELLLQSALAEGGKLDMAEAEKLLNEQRQYHGEEAFQEMLKMQGMSIEEVLKRVAGGMLIEKYHEDKIEAYSKDNPVSEEEAKKFYDEHPDRFEMPASLSAAHILLKFDSNTPDEAEKTRLRGKLAELRKSLLAGADFAEAAKRHSACPSKEQGGDLGQFQEGQMVPEFEEALKKLKTGEISDPVETQFGYHLIKAGERKEAGKVDFAEAKEQICEQLQMQKAEEAFRKHIDELLAKSQHKINLPEPKMPQF